jgi:Zn-finger protein
MIRKLARQAWREMWSKVYSPESYIEGGCSFCKTANEDCNICLLPKYFCEKEDGKLKTDTLISNIRYIRDYVINSSSHAPYRMAARIRFDHFLTAIKRGIKDMMYYGKVRKKTVSMVRSLIK